MGAHGSYNMEADSLQLLHVVTWNIMISVLVYLFWISNWGTYMQVVNQPTDQCQLKTLLSFGCAEGRAEESWEDRTSFGHALLDVDGFSWLVHAQSCALELKNRWLMLVASSTAHHCSDSGTVVHDSAKLPRNALRSAFVQILRGTSSSIEVNVRWWFIKLHMLLIKNISNHSKKNELTLWYWSLIFCAHSKKLELINMLRMRYYPMSFVTGLSRDICKWISHPCYMLTMHNDNTPMSEPILMNGLSIHQCLVQECPQHCSLVESNNTIISLDLL